MPQLTDIPSRRLRSHRLSGQAFESAIDVVRWLGPIQAQDYGAAKWALGQRTLDATEADIDRLFDDGSLLRTHVLRPTWHFVLPEDVRWLLDLTAPRIRRRLAGRYRELDIDDDLIDRAGAAFIHALAGGRYLTRPELGQVLAASGIAPDGQRLPHLLMAAELTGVLVSGPRRGKQFSYGLLEERVPRTRGLDRDEALMKLAGRYFRSHGPAQLQDFVWWSGLTMIDAHCGIELAGGALEVQTIDGRRYWFDEELPAASEPAAIAHLLPNFDEYTVGYRDRSDLLAPGRQFDPALFSFGSVLSNVLTINGLVQGAWRRTSVGKSIQIEVRPLDPLHPTDVAALDEPRERLSRFLERMVDLA